MIHPLPRFMWARLRALALWGVWFGGSAWAAPLTLAVADIPYAAPVLIAAAQGYFEAEGLAVKVRHCSIGRVCLKLLLDGQAQVATVADTPIALASFSHKDFAVIATTTLSGRENQLLVRQDRGINNPADLKGKRIGIVKGSSGHYFVDVFLLLHGVKTADVTLVALPLEDTAGPLVRGEVDAAGLFGTAPLDAIRRLGGQAKALPSPSFFSVTFNLVSAPQVPDADLLKLLRAVERAVELIRNQPDAARRIVATAIKTDPGALTDTWGNFDFRLQLGQVLITTLEGQARWALREGLAPAGSAMPDYLDFVRTGPLKALDPRAVRLVK